MQFKKSLQKLSTALIEKLTKDYSKEIKISMIKDLNTIQDEIKNISKN